MHMWDMYSRKQSRVNRGTFGAELNNTLESSESGMLFAGLMYEMVRGPASSQVLHEAVHCGGTPIGVHLVGDAHAVFSAVTAAEVKQPNEKSLLYAVRSLRDRLDSGAVKRLHRCDTRDMLADALTKGGISRAEIIAAFATGSWFMKVKEQLHSWPS